MSASAELKALLDTRCIDAPERLLPYERPERGEPGQASCLLLPESETELGELLQLCTAQGIGLVISAGRTGLVEAQRPQGEAVLSLERLRRPLTFTLADGREFHFPASGNAESWSDALAQWWQAAGRPPVAGAEITVEAALAIDALNLILQPLGLMLPMEMGSSASATAGACVANGSAGANAVCYGTAAHMALRAWGLHADGSPAESVGQSWQAPAPDVLAINSASLDPQRGLIGTQGAFGLITRVRLLTYPIPALREGALIPVGDMPQAMRVLAHARAVFGSDIEEFEFISRSALELVRQLRGDEFRLPFAVEPDAPFLILLQVKSGDAEDDLAARLYEFLAGDLALPDEQIGYAPLKALKHIRHSITEASNARMRSLGGGRLAFDTATPVACFGDYLAALEAELAAREAGVEFVAFGHAGVGGAHLHLLGTREKPVSARAAELVELVFDVTEKFGGTYSAEHGVGSKWGGEFLRRTPPAQLQAILAARRLHDPRNILNPRSFGFDRAP